MNNSYVLTPEILRCGGPQVLAIIQESLNLSVTTLLYATQDEGWCSAYVIEIDKTGAMCQMEALVALESRRLHWLEEWPVEETTDSGARSIAEKWLVPVFLDYDFRTYGGDDIGACIQDTLRPVVDWIMTHPLSRTGGIFKNGARVVDNTTHPTLSEPFVGGMILDREWNSVVVLYETATKYGLFNWGTSA